AFQAGLLKSYLGIFMAILLGVTIILVTPAGPTLATVTSISPTPSAQIPSARNTLLGIRGVPFIRSFQGTRGTNTTPGTRGGAAVGARGRAAAPCVDKTKRYVGCGDGTGTDNGEGRVWVKQVIWLSFAGVYAGERGVAGL